MSTNIEELIEKINSVDQSNVGTNADARAMLLQAAQALSIRLETPWEFVQRVIWQEVGKQHITGEPHSLLPLFLGNHHVYCRGRSGRPPQLIRSSPL